MIHEVSNPFFSEIASGVLAAAENHDRMVMIANTRRDPEQEIRYVAEMRAMRVQALLLAGSEFVDDHAKQRLDVELDKYASMGGRVVLMRPHPSRMVVMPDTTQGGRLMAEHLIGLGHRQIGVVTGPEQLATIRDRLRAFESRLAEDGIEIVHVVSADFSREGGYAGTRHLLQSYPEVTALFALNDLMGVGAIHAAHDLGLRVPDDISVAGFNDLPSARDVTPPLTTIRLPLRQMGERALEVALGDGVDVEEPVVLDVELVARPSTGPPRRHTGDRRATFKL